MEGWKETEVDKNPVNWEMVLFPKFVILQRGKDLTKVNFKTGNVPVAGSSGIIGYHDTSFVKAPGVTVGRSGSCGQVCYYETDFWAHNTSLYVKDFNGNDELFSYFYLSYLDIGRYKTGVSVPTLDRNSLNNIKIPLPPLPEQRKIAHVLSTVQKAIEQQDNLICTTNELKKALMQKLFTEGTRGEPQRKTEIGLVPESWEVVRIGDMYEFTSKPRGLDIGSPVPFIPMDLVPFNELEINKYVLRDKVSSGTYVENGDLLLAKITPSFENGKQGFVSIDKPFAYATTEVIPIKEKQGLSDKFYLYYFLLKDDIRSQLTGKMEGSTGRQRLSKTVLEETLIPKPSLSEQIEIAKMYISFDKKISFCNSKKQTLTALFKTLLHELMTGQRRVHEMEFK